MQQVTPIVRRDARRQELINVKNKDSEHMELHKPPAEALHIERLTLQVTILRDVNGSQLQMVPVPSRHHRFT